MNEEEKKPPLTPYYPGGIPLPQPGQQKPIMKMLGKLLPKPKMKARARGIGRSQSVSIGHKKGKQIFY